MTFAYSRRSTDRKLLSRVANSLVRKSKRFASRLQYIILKSDITLAVFLGGFGLIVWAIFGIYMFTNDLNNYSKMFPFGHAEFWAGNYIFCGLSMMILAMKRFSPFPSLLIGGWVATIWGWSALARMTETATLQTGNATSIVYIILGLLMVQRSARKNASR